MEKVGDGIYTFDNLFTDQEIETFETFVKNARDRSFFTNGKFKNGKTSHEFAVTIGERVLTKFKQENLETNSTFILF